MPVFPKASSGTPLRRFYQRLLAGGESEACALGAPMNKRLRIAFGVLKHRSPFAENLAAIRTQKLSLL